MLASWRNYPVKGKKGGGNKGKIEVELRVRLFGKLIRFRFVTVFTQEICTSRLLYFITLKEITRYHFMLFLNSMLLSIWNGLLSLLSLLYVILIWN